MILLIGIIMVGFALCLSYGALEQRHSRGVFTLMVVATVSLAGTGGWILLEHFVPVKVTGAGPYYELIVLWRQFIINVILFPLSAIISIGPFLARYMIYYKRHDQQEEQSTGALEVSKSLGGEV